MDETISARLFVGILILAVIALIYPWRAAAQSSAGCLAGPSCFGSVPSRGSTYHPRSNTSTSSSTGACIDRATGVILLHCGRSNSALNRFNAIQQNLQQEDQMINNATNEIINTIQQYRNRRKSYSPDTSTYSAAPASEPAPAYSNVPSGPDPEQLRQQAASDLLNSANQLLDSAAPAGVPSTPAGAGNADSGVAASVANVLGDGSPSSSVANDVSNVLGGTGSVPAQGSVAQSVSAALAGDSALSLGLFAAAENDLSLNSDSTPTAAEEETLAEQQIGEADNEVFQTDASQTAASSDEVTQEVENSMPGSENTPELGSWFQQGLNYLRQAVENKIADGSSSDRATQINNEIDMSANPFTGLMPDIAAAGNPWDGLYNYMDTLWGKTHELLGMVTDPNPGQ